MPMNMSSAELVSICMSVSLSTTVHDLVRCGVCDMFMAEFMSVTVHVSVGFPCQWPRHCSLRCTCPRPGSIMSVTVPVSVAVSLSMTGSMVEFVSLSNCPCPLSMTVSVSVSVSMSGPSCPIVGN